MTPSEIKSFIEDTILEMSLQIKEMIENRILESLSQIKEMIENRILESLPQIKDAIETSLPEHLSNHTLLFVRHGSTTLNENGDKIRGWRDVPLSPQGIGEGKKLAKKLKGKKVDGILYSDLIRTKQTAEIISEITGFKIIEPSFALRPWNVGKFTGIESKIAVPQLMEYIYNPDTIVPKGESFNTFKMRFLDELKRIQTTYLGKNIMIISHHRNERMLAGWVKNGMPNNYSIDEHYMALKGIPPAGFKEYHHFFPIEKIESIKGDPGKDADETAIMLNVLSQIPKLDEEKIIKNILTKISFNKETPEELRDKLNTLKEPWLSTQMIIGLPTAIRGNMPLHGGGDTIRYVDLSSQCNGITKTFTLTRVNRVIGVFGTQFPVIARPDIDWTFNQSTNILTLTDAVSAPVTGQTLWALIVEG